MKKNPIFVTASATCMEVYDFLIYSFFSVYLSKIFFLSTDKISVFVETLIVLSIGYLVRPLGGLIIGRLGDTIGRKKAFLISIHGLAISTFVIALIPSYNSIGIFSSIALALCRIVQGICHGAELPGAIIYAIESANTKKRFATGIIFCGVATGGILSTVVGYLITTLYTEHQIIEYAWRIPFIFGGTLSLIAIYFRYNIPETYEYLQLQDKEASPITFILKNHKTNLVVAIGISLLPSLLIIFGHYIPAYFKLTNPNLHVNIYSYMFFGMICFAIAIPLFSYFGPVANSE